jgi:hypothetical protein
MPSRLSLKIIMIGSWLIFVAAWVSLLVHLIFHWRSMSVDFHYDLVGLLVFFGVLWARLFRGKNSEVDHFVTSMALAIVAEIVNRS